MVYGNTESICEANGRGQLKNKFPFLRKGQARAPDGRVVAVQSARGNEGWERRARVSAGKAGTGPGTSGRRGPKPCRGHG